jgi:NAD(P)H-dependent FMN reductase
MRILGISGSLRAASSNGAVLRAAADLAPPGVHFTVYDGLAGLPHFNPDLDVEPAPGPVADLRASVRSSGAVLICSPEYAHGVPGSLKNALDWLVGSGEFIDKPVALINASPRSTHAQASLAETLATMSAKVVRGASVALPLSTNRFDEAALLADPAVSAALRGAVAELIRAAEDGNGRAEVSG